MRAFVFLVHTRFKKQYSTKNPAQKIERLNVAFVFLQQDIQWHALRIYNRKLVTNYLQCWLVLVVVVGPPPQLPPRVVYSRPGLGAGPAPGDPGHGSFTAGRTLLSSSSLCRRRCRRCRRRCLRDCCCRCRPRPFVSPTRLPHPARVQSTLFHFSFYVSPVSSPQAEDKTKKTNTKRCELTTLLF